MCTTNQPPVAPPSLPQSHGSSNGKCLVIESCGKNEKNISIYKVVVLDGEGPAHCRISGPHGLIIFWLLLSDGTISVDTPLGNKTWMTTTGMSVGWNNTSELILPNNQGKFSLGNMIYPVEIQLGDEPALQIEASNPEAYKPSGY